MKIRGNTVGTTAQRPDYLQEDPNNAAYIKNKLRFVVGKEEPTAYPAIWFMETDEGGYGTLYFIDESGKKSTLLPATNIAAVSDLRKTLDDLTKSIGGLLPLDGSTAMSGDLAMGGNKVTGLGTPADDSDAATKSYVDAHSVYKSVTIPASGWQGDGPYTQDIQLTGILETDNPHYGIVLSGTTDEKLAQKEAFGYVDEMTTADDIVTVTCLEDKPAVDITILIEVNRGVELGSVISVAMLQLDSDESGSEIVASVDGEDYGVINSTVNSEASASSYDFTVL